MQNSNPDVVVIGGGISGVSVGLALQKAGRQVTLLEATERVGGFSALEISPFVSDLPEAPSALSWLSELVGQSVSAEIIEQPTWIYNGLQPQQFFGFADDPPESYDEMLPYLCSRQQLLSVPVAEWTKLLLEKFQQLGGVFQPLSWVAGIDIEDSRVIGIHFGNGQKKLQAHDFVFTGSVHSLLALLPERPELAKVRGKIKKGPFWSLLCVQLDHEVLPPSHEANSGQHLLRGNVNDPVDWMWGGFFTNPNSAGGSSQWFAWLSEDGSEDPEVGSSVVKVLRRQLKKHFGSVAENARVKKIYFAPKIAGKGQLSLSRSLTLPGLSNLYVASAQIVPGCGRLGALVQAHRVSESILGGNTEKERSLEPSVTQPTEDIIHESSPSL